MPRVVGSTVEDGRIGTPKVEIAERIALGANPNLTFEAIQGDIVDQSVAGAFTDCDYIFLAADSMQARLVFNALVHQYLVPGVQVGSKVPVDETTGDVGDVSIVSRPVTPNSGCLWCNGLIDAAGLQDEALSEEERTAQRYVPEVIAPSVITLNAVAAAEAVNHFLFYVTGLLNSDVTGDFVRFRPRRREVWMDEPRKDADCSQCSDRKASKFARGDTIRLPVRQVRSVTEF